MASTKSSVLRTGLDEFPDSEAVPAKLYDIFVTIYNTINSLALNLESTLGIADVDPADYASKLIEDKRVYCIYDRLSVVELEAGEALSYGTLVSIGSNGKLYKSHYGFTVWGNQGLGQAFDGVVQSGISNKQVAAGEMCGMITKGVIGLSGITPAVPYFGVVVPGYNGALTGTPPYGQSNAFTYGVGEATIGVTLSDDALFYEGIHA